MNWFEWIIISAICIITAGYATINLAGWIAEAHMSGLIRALKKLKEEQKDGSKKKQEKR